MLIMKYYTSNCELTKILYSKWINNLIYSSLNCYSLESTAFVQIKLLYFDLYGRGEIIRLILKYAGVDFKVILKDVTVGHHKVNVKFAGADFKAILIDIKVGHHKVNLKFAGADFKAILKDVTVGHHRVNVKFAGAEGNYRGCQGWSSQSKS